MKVCKEMTANESLADNPRAFLTSTLTVATNAAKKIAGSDLNQIRENIVDFTNSSLSFTKTIVREMKYMGFLQPQRINEIFKKSRALTEELNRYAKVEIIDPLIEFKFNHKEAYAKLSEIAFLASRTEVNPFESRSKYEGKTITFSDPTTLKEEKRDKAAVWDELQSDLQALDRMNKNGRKLLKGVFDIFPYFRNKILQTLIKQIKTRAGESGIPDSQTSPEVRDTIDTLKEQFKRADSDAYITFLREGKHVVFARQTETIKDGEGNDVTQVKQGDPIFSGEYATEREATEAIDKLNKENKNIQIEYFRDSEMTGDKSINGKVLNRLNNFSDTLNAELNKVSEDIKNNPNIDEATRLKRINDMQNLKQDLKKLSMHLFPDTSVRRNLVERRKGTPGYMTDVLQVIGEMSNRYATQIGGIEYAADFEKEYRSLDQQIRDTAGNTPDDVRKKSKARSYADRLVSIRQNQQNLPTVFDRVANFGNRLGFLWYLGYNPASAFINFTQVPGVTVGLLTGKFGFSRTSEVISEVMGAYKSVIRASSMLTKYTYSERLEELKLLDDTQLKKQYGLTREELEMLEHNDNLGEMRSGMHMYDMNLAFENATEASVILERFNKWSAFMFQKVELLNREVTSLAALRLAKKYPIVGRGKITNKKELFDFTNDMITESQGSYATDQAPAPFMNPAIRFIGMFKKFSAFMASVYINLFKEAIRNANPKARRVALQQFTVLMGMSAAMAGAAGMPFYYIIRDVLNFVFGSPISPFHDKNVPYDADLALMEGLEGTLGAKGARIVYKGLLNEVTGMDISSRVGYQGSFLLGGGNIDPSLPFAGGVLGLREIPEHSPSEKASYIFDELLGAGFSLGRGALKGIDDIVQGHTIRGIEKMTPVFLRNPLKTARYELEGGVLTKRGDPVVEDLMTREMILQFMGFSPARVSLQYEVNRRSKNIEQAILKRKNRLADRYFFLEKLHGVNSPQAKEYYREEIVPFNKAIPELKMDRKFITKSRKIRKKFTKTKVFDGVSLNKSLQKRLQPYQSLLTDDDSGI